MKKYPIVNAGEWVQPIRRGYGLACCDCGLVHTMDFRVIKNGRGTFIQFRAWRDERETKKLRKQKGKST